jgi:hypothetical protein
LKKKKGIDDPEMLDRLLDPNKSKSTKTRTFVSEVFETELQSRISLSTAELEKQLIEKSLEIKRLKMIILRNNNKEDLSVTETTDTGNLYLY